MVGVSDEPLPAHGGHPGRQRRRRLRGRRETGQRARERQLLREKRAGARERAWGQRQADRVTQTSREEVRGFQGMTPVPHPHKRTNIKDLDQWLAASVGRGPTPANGRRRRQRGRGSCCSCVLERRGEAGVGDLSRCPRLHHLPLPPSSPLVCSESRGTSRALSSASHFPFSLPRQMFFSASVIPVAGW